MVVTTVSNNDQITHNQSKTKRSLSMEQISISNLDPMIQTGLSKTTKRRDSWSEGIMKWVEWDAFDGKGRNVMQFSTVQSSFSFLLDCKEVSERNKIASYVVRNTHYERIFKWDEARNRVLKRVRITCFITVKT